MADSGSSGRSRTGRASALWGTGGHSGGGARGRAAWAAAAAATLTLAVPVAATAAGPKDHPKPGAHYVTPGLLAQAAADPAQQVQVIVQSDAGADAAQTIVGALTQPKNEKRLKLVKGVAVQVPAAAVAQLAQVSGLTITPDAPVRLLGRGPGGNGNGNGNGRGASAAAASAAANTTAGGYSSTDLWPYRTGNADLWPLVAKYSQPTIAVVDSGLDSRASGLGKRLLANIDLSTLGDNSRGDGLGHGTAVTGLAAMDASGKAGADPKANIVSLDVLNDQGDARVSDVIAACDWIVQHQQQYNIRVANFSLASTQQSSFTNDPLDQAVERLWFHGVTVVAASGNYGNADGSPSGVLSAPGNDPFVITVGAADLNGTGTVADDTVPFWSAWGHTHDGFAKPELVAPGRYITVQVPARSTIAVQHANRIVAPGFENLSGTSFAAPIVSGTVAELLAAHPDWTPDMVKGALMASARAMPAVTSPGQAGVGELDAVRAFFTTAAPNPNAPLEQFVSIDPATGDPTFSADDWTTAAQADPAWDQVSWDSVSWDSVSWDSVSWDSVSWDSVSWDSVSWDSVSWDSVSWDSVSWDSAAADDSGPLGYPVTAADLQQIAGEGPVLNAISGS